MPSSANCRYFILYTGKGLLFSVGTPPLSPTLTPTLPPLSPTLPHRHPTLTPTPLSGTTSLFCANWNCQNPMFGQCGQTFECQFLTYSYFIPGYSLYAICRSHIATAPPPHYPKLQLYFWYPKSICTFSEKFAQHYLFFPQWKKVSHCTNGKRSIPAGVSKGNCEKLEIQVQVFSEKVQIFL